VPLVVRLSTSSAETQQIDDLPNSWHLSWDIKREKLQAKLADGLMTHSNAHRHKMAAELNINPDRISVIPLGVTVDPDFKRTYTTRTDHEVVYLGRLERRKGAVDLLRAVPLVLDQVPNAQFTFIGPDRAHCPGGRTHQQYLQDEFPGSVRQRIVLKGSLSESEVTEHLQNADVFVAPSLYESFGLIFLEAMRWGTPVIGTTAGGIPEIVQNDESGILVPPGDHTELAAAITALLKDPIRRHRLGDAGRRRVKTHFSAQDMTTKTLAFYSSVLRSANRSTAQAAGQPR
jgi:glycogen(starch) synthase